MKKFEVIVPTEERRTVIVDNYFYADTKEEADKIVSWVKENGLVEMQPACEEIVGTLEADTLCTNIDEIEVKEVDEGVFFSAIVTKNEKIIKINSFCESEEDAAEYLWKFYTNEIDTEQGDELDKERLLKGEVVSIYDEKRNYYTLQITETGGDNE